MPGRCTYTFSWDFYLKSPRLSQLYNLYKNQQYASTLGPFSAL